MNGAADPSSLAAKEKALKILFTFRPQRGLERVRESVPDAQVVVCDQPPKIPSAIADADVACVGHFNAEIFRAARKLRWVHAFGGGVGAHLFPEFAASAIPLTCLKGCFDIPAAEYALAVMLAFSRKLEYDIRRRPARSFVETEPRELFGKTVGIVGLGGMGGEIARRCRAFGMRVIGLARRPRAERPAEVERILTPEGLPSLLRESDFVVVAVPLTNATRGLIGSAELALMKPTAYLIDVSGRLPLYDQDALVEALKSGRIAGANLQLVPPPDSELWELDNLLLAFHRVVSEEQYDRCIERFCENVRRFQRDEDLLGLVDKEAGY